MQWGETKHVEGSETPGIDSNDRLLGLNVYVVVRGTVSI